MLRLISQSSCPGKSPLSCYIQRFRKVPTRLSDKWFCFRFTGFLSPTLRLEVSCYVYFRKVPAEHEIGFLKKKLGSTQIRENPLRFPHRAICSFCSNQEEPALDLTKRP